MDTLNRISRWLKRQHLVTYCVTQDNTPWCANAFYLYDAQSVAFYFLSDPGTRHGKMAGIRAPAAGTVNGQPKTIALIRGVQFSGELRLLSGNEAAMRLAAWYRRFPAARAMSAPVWELRIDELKFTDNTLGFGKKLIWARVSGE